MLVVTGQIPQRFIGKGTGQLHEIKDQLNAVSGITKFQGSIQKPEEVPGTLAQAISAATSGRPQPVVWLPAPRQDTHQHNSASGRPLGGNSPSSRATCSSGRRPTT